LTAGTCSSKCGLATSPDWTTNSSTTRAAIFNQEAAREIYLRFLQQAGYPVNDAITQKLFVSDFGLGRFTEAGLGVILWWGTRRTTSAAWTPFCSRPDHPEHWHVKVRDIPAKMESWLVRHGEIYAYAEGEPTPNLKAKLAAADAANVTVKRERILGVGEIAGISRPLEKHWMQAGPQGAIFTEFSTFHTGEAVKFTDAEVRF